MPACHPYSDTMVSWHPLASLETWVSTWITHSVMKVGVFLYLYNLLYMIVHMYSKLLAVELQKVIPFISLLYTCTHIVTYIFKRRESVNKEYSFKFKGIFVFVYNNYLRGKHLLKFQC